jgi:hypothetical protein
MTMDLINVYFVFTFLALGILFTIGALYYKGLWWLSIVAGLIWILLGVGSMTYAEVFYYQRTLAIVFIVMGIGVMFTPLWYKSKEQKSGAEVLEGADHFSEMDSEVEDLESEGRSYRGKKPKNKK